MVLEQLIGMATDAIQGNNNNNYICNNVFQNVRSDARNNCYDYNNDCLARVAKPKILIRVPELWHRTAICWPRVRLVARRSIAHYKYTWRSRDRAPRPAIGWRAVVGSSDPEVCPCLITSLRIRKTSWKNSQRGPPSRGCRAGCRISKCSAARRTRTWRSASSTGSASISARSSPRNSATSRHGESIERTRPAEGTLPRDRRRTTPPPAGCDHRHANPITDTCFHAIYTRRRRSIPTRSPILPQFWGYVRLAAKHNYTRIQQPV